MTPEQEHVLNTKGIEPTMPFVPKIHPDNLPPNLHWVNSLALIALAMDIYDAPTWLWVVHGVLSVLAMIGFMVAVSRTATFDIFQKRFRR